MKITDLAIIVCLLFTGVSVSIDLRQHKLIEAEELKARYNEILYTATEDATFAMREPETFQSTSTTNVIKEGYERKVIEINPNLDKSLNRFYKTMYTNMGIENDKVAQDAFKVHMPVKMAIAYDGYFVNSWQDVYNGIKAEALEMWSLKKPYSYFDQEHRLVVDFTLDDLVYVFDTATGSWGSGRRAELEIRYPGVLFSGANFDNIRRQTIINAVRNDLEYSTAKYNSIAKHYAWGYNFNIPLIQDDEWQNTINNVCFIAFLQGLPVGIENYDTFGFGGSKLVKSKKYYGKVLGGVRYYHCEGCSLGVATDISFDSRKDAARMGYYPCGSCRP